MRRSISMRVYSRRLTLQSSAWIAFIGVISKKILTTARHCTTYTNEKEYLKLEGKFMVLGRAGNLPSLTWASDKLQYKLQYIKQTAKRECQSQEVCTVA
jgi:hypothetical protein